MLNKTELIAELKKEHNAVILAHNYQLPEVQDIADYVGDSFGLSQKAAELDAEVIVFCGVRFMAESVKILSPAKIVLIPEKDAGCPMAGMVDIDGLRKIKNEYPEAAVVTYVNSTAAVKAESDICCTSSNALDVVKSLEEERIIFVPDKNLGHYVASRTEKEIITWNGYCPAHNRVQVEEVKRIKRKYPYAPITVHPECNPEVVSRADYVGSTAGILNYAASSNSDTLIIGTERELIHRLKKENPGKKFYPLSSCLICPDMKKINLQKIVDVLRTMKSTINISEKIRSEAYKALKKMLEIN